MISRVKDADNSVITHLDGDIVNSDKLYVKFRINHTHLIWYV